MQKKSRPIELLAPAKDLVCGIEAINHGADAVYIGAPKFSARSAAGNTLEDIKELCAYAHLFNSRVYVAFNTILKEDELKDAEQLIWELYEIGVDALIIQDMGITRMNIPPIPLHASTQTDNRTPGKVLFLEKSGFSQVVLARELSVKQIKDIAEQTTVPLEVFIHGALCVSYSGQCYLSAALNGRSANRGECAQSCRLPYSMVDAEGKVIIANKHLLSLKDLNRSDSLEKLIDAGVSSLKIEGRLKDVSYVKNVTAYYRKRLDEIIARRPEYKAASSGHSVYTFEPRPEKSFNRGFTDYFLQERTTTITSFDTPKSLGEFIGTVKELKGNSFTVAGVKPLNNGDGLTFFNRQEELEGFRVNRVDDNRVFPMEMPQLHPKTKLYRNYDHQFDKLIQKNSAERKLSVRMEFIDNTFGFTLCVTDETDARVMVTLPFEKEVAKSDQQDNIKKQLSKLGNTPFVVSDVSVSMSESWFVPSSVLTEMRRLAVEKLLQNRRVRYRQAFAQKGLKESVVPFPEEKLTYLGNVSNSYAQSFYESHGLKQVEPAFELKPVSNAPLMFTKHCLRYSMGWCPVYQKQKSPYKEPYYLIYKDTRLELSFDCKHCQMTVQLKVES